VLEGGTDGVNGPGAQLVADGEEAAGDGVVALGENEAAQDGADAIGYAEARFVPGVEG
jgi:hypothetical protein